MKIGLILFLIFSPFILPQDKYRLKYNNIDISFDNKGAFGVNAGGYPGGYFDDEVFLFSSGFALSGYKEGSLFVNGVMPSSLVSDYFPGKIGSDPLDLKNILYEVSPHPPFSSSWQYWNNAVELGADFIDGDSDGIYNPVDKNGNMISDSDEDKPFIEGEFSIWTIFNDGVPPGMRRYNTISQIGIEIQQTVFASQASSLSNSIFIRYRIVYKGLSDTDPAELDSVLFSIWTDPDIGDAVDDLMGTDSLLNASFIYNDSSDHTYGNNPPAFFQNFLQTAPVYIGGVTYINNNSNHIFDANIDTPLDTSYNKKGELGITSYLGAADFGIKSSSFTYGGDPTFDSPNNAIEARYRMEGLNRKGEKVDPCSTTFGKVFNDDCVIVNPFLNFSGDPVKHEGWLNIIPHDAKTFTTAAPFQLKRNEPVDIIVAYIVGRGIDPLTSITSARELSFAAKKFYESNFTQIPVGIKDEPEQAIGEFQLHQNYPNPFNPSTNLSFVIGKPSFVNLSVYDILGNKVAELVNKEKPAGEHSIQFDGSNYSSGIYFYKLTAVTIGHAQWQVSGQAGSFSSIKKLILLK